MGALTWLGLGLPALAWLAGPASAQGTVAAPVLVQAEAKTIAAACAGRDAQVEGNRNQVTLDGPCRSLLLRGVGNRVVLTLAPEASIRVEGSGNRVRYAGPGAPPAIQNFGADNVVQAAGEALDLAGDDRYLATDCAGRDVIINGLRSLYLLRGGCRSLTVTGGLDVVQVEMQPGAPITVDGGGIVVSWAASGNRAPVTIVHGASHIQRTEMIGGLPAR